MIPLLFMEGIRELMIIDRADKNKCLRRILLTNPYEHNLYIPEFIVEATQYPGEKVRVYLSVNSRSIRKAIRKFKYREIDISCSNDEIQIKQFYLELNYQFRHILMQPAQRETKYFLLDVDSKNILHLSAVESFLGQKNIKIINSYETPNGMHFITEPFNMHELKMEYVTVKTDGLMLLWAKDSNNAR